MANIERDDEPDPRTDGDVTVIGPECFAAKDGSVLNWRGVNYVPQDLHAGAASDAAKGRALIDRMFELDRPSAEWEWALAELRMWCMDPQRLRGQ